MIQAQGTGAALIAFLMGIAVLLVCLLLLAAAIGKVRPKKAGLCIVLVFAFLTVVLLLHSRSGGDFPRLVRIGSMGQNRVPFKMVPIKVTPRK